MKKIIIKNKTKKLNMEECLEYVTFLLKDTRTTGNFYFGASFYNGGSSEIVIRRKIKNYIWFKKEVFIVCEYEVDEK